MHRVAGLVRGAEPRLRRARQKEADARGLRGAGGTGVRRGLRGLPGTGIRAAQREPQRAAAEKESSKDPEGTRMTSPLSACRITR